MSWPRCDRLAALMKWRGRGVGPPFSLAKKLRRAVSVDRRLEWKRISMALCLITACSSGFGEAIALRFADRGDSVVATMRNPEAAPAALKGRANIELVPLDVTDEASRQAALDHAISRHGRIDTLVNNAGIAAFGSIEDTPDELSRRIFETNYFGPVALMRAVLPIMRSQGGGRIINVTALGAIISTPLLGVYCASKHALDWAAAVVDIEGRPFGVRAPAVPPRQ